MTDWFEELEKDRTRNKIYAGEYKTEADIDKEREEMIQYNFSDNSLEIIKQAIKRYFIFFKSF